MSSANINTLTDKLKIDGKSLMKRINVPKCEPCGTPEQTGINYENECLSLNSCTCQTSLKLLYKIN